MSNLTLSDSYLIQQDLLSPTSHSFDLQLMNEELLDDNLNINGGLYSYYIPPVIEQTLEPTFFLSSMAELDLQKNLVKDVFFSPAISQSSHLEKPLLFGDNDNYSLTSSSSSCSPTYQYEDSVNLVFLDDKKVKNDLPQDQNAFLYGIDLFQPLQSSKDEEQEKPEPSKNDVKKYKSPKSITITKKVKKMKTPIVNKKSKLHEDIKSLKKSWEHKTDNQIVDETFKTVNQPRYTDKPTIYQTFTKQSIDWCRYCGTTEGVNWRPGPWGKRTLCNKHGCDYKGYGFACKLPRLNLTSFEHETIDQRVRPVLQMFCSHCHEQTSWEENTLVFCDGCPKSFHQHCFDKEITNDLLKSNEPWYCSEECKDNIKHKRVVVELPRKKLPLMRSPAKDSAL